MMGHQDALSPDAACAGVMGCRTHSGVPVATVARMLAEKNSKHPMVPDRLLIHPAPWLGIAVQHITES
eukprot:NODE_806_length_1158_cov_148.705140_g651_i0.p7 GENE.NODE_806_length_1158_cov_148.705140_g651_i0~~NODE_806_length_1158_cov_148.705140_g651_i0.p7  ORF type:complete len:68 (-),score=5.30 NODE_806_length_1158_cov_148.705140_g651_i0:63-266(-)